MNTSTRDQAPRIVVLKSDPTYGHFLGQFLLSRWPRARVSVFHRGKDALRCIRQTKPDLLLAGVKLDDMDGLEHLEALVDSEVAIVVVTSRADPHTFRMLRRVRYGGLFDALTDRVESLPDTIGVVLRRQPYVSPGFLRRLEADGPIDSLTPGEQLVFAVIGDGTKDDEAAKRLALSPETIRTHRKRIMAKVGIHSKALLTRYTVQQGFILLAPDSVRRPGFERRLANGDVRHRRGQPARAAIEPRIKKDRAIPFAQEA